MESRVGVVTGGVGRERDRSLLSGHAVAESLHRQGFETRVLDAAAPSFVDDVQTVEVAFLAIAGQYAEDGKLQGALEILGVPYTGSGVLASALAMHKPSAKAMAGAQGIPLLPHIAVPGSVQAEQAATWLAAQLGLPVMIKPESEGGSIDARTAHSQEQLAALLAQPRRTGQQMMAEPFRTGRSITVGVLDAGDDPVALPALEAQTQGEFYDYLAKRDPHLHTYVCPADLPAGIGDRLAEMACAAHRALGCAAYSRSDFIVGDDGGAWWLELNTLPGLSRGGNLATMAIAAGIEYDDLVRRILASARRAPGYCP